MIEKTAESVWNNCLKLIQDNVSPQSFKTWFEPIKPVKLDNKIYYKGNFEDSAKARGVLAVENNFLNTLDSSRYQEIYMTKKEKLDKHLITLVTN
jgi:chromosomal replication initiation ATPase DnaA